MHPRAIISLEVFGDALRRSDRHFASERVIERHRSFLGRDVSRPWVARLLGLDDTYGFKREFVRGQRDESRASNTGGRGVFYHYALTDGLYEVSERLSWKRTRRY